VREEGFKLFKREAAREGKKSPFMKTSRAQKTKGREGEKRNVRPFIAQGKKGEKWSSAIPVPEEKIPPPPL